MRERNQIDKLIIASMLLKFSDVFVTIPSIRFPHQSPFYSENPRISIAGNQGSEIKNGDADFYLIPTPSEEKIPYGYPKFTHLLKRWIFLVRKIDFLEALS